jgi:Tol biopolymer transport system component
MGELGVSKEIVRKSHMKRRWLTTLIVLSTSLCQARDVVSPDGNYAVRAQESITLVNVKTGQQLLVLTRNTQGVSRVEVAWSPDSRKVALIKDYPRGSEIIAAWASPSTANLVGQSMEQWHKTLDTDEEAVPFTRRAEKEFSGRLTSENRVFKGWASSDAIRVQGTMHFASGKQCQYQYLLEFHPNAVTHLDRGGYEEGAIVGKDFTML